jgi:hypothetical protein
MINHHSNQLAYIKEALFYTINFNDFHNESKCKSVLKSETLHIANICPSRDLC